MKSENYLKNYPILSLFVLEVIYSVVFVFNKICICIKKLKKSHKICCYKLSDYI